MLIRMLKDNNFVYRDGSESTDESDKPDEREKRLEPFANEPATAEFVKSVTELMASTPVESTIQIIDAVSDGISPDPVDSEDRASINTSNLPSLQGLLNDVSGYFLSPIPPDDDAMSTNTRNEYWSISSFHTRTPPDDDEIPPDNSPDFVLPLDSLLKPMKKSTYKPVKQSTVQEFLAQGAWKAAPEEPEPETLWTKKVPLVPVTGVVGDIDGIAPPLKPPCEHDPFLESIQDLKQDPQRRRRINRYPGNEISYTGYMREDVYEQYTEHHVYVKRISTQSTTPEWYRRSRHEKAAPPESMKPTPEPVKPTHKVRPFFHR
jgi:hypothetical protein